MSSSQKSYKYIEWLAADEMHEHALLWFSELNFIRDEQQFLNKLIKSYTIQLIEPTVFEESKTLINKLVKSEQELVPLMEQLHLHENQLEIITDNIEQPKMERAFIATHRDLTLAMNSYNSRYRKLKKSLFTLFTNILKKEKQKRLLRE